MQHQPPSPQIPDCTWQRSIGLGWKTPYTVRYPSNLDDGPWHGMPLGGFGAGCIGRSHRGDFNLWHVDSGEHIFQTMPACQFSVFEQVGNQTQAYALSTEPPDDGSLSTWQWYPASQGIGNREQGIGNRKQGTDDEPSPSRLSPLPSHLSPSTGTYHALYPRSWFVYENVFQANLTCEQFSPILPDNYQETSYPVAIFEWTAHNPTDQPITLSLMLTWQNMVGWFTNASKSPEVKLRDDGSPVYDYQPRLGDSTGNVNRWVTEGSRVGIVMEKAKAIMSDRQPSEGDGQWAILVGDPQSGIAVQPPANIEVFYQTRWNPTGDGSEVWRTFAETGALLNQTDATAAEPGEQIAGAIAVRFTVQPGETQRIPFTLSWDFPVMEFAQGVEYFKRYTDFFGRGGENAWAIAHTALEHYQTWQQQIQAWQQPILEKPLPNWFKMALFNELYILTDGGTLWSAATEQDRVGQFAVLECIDYRWYESLDVRLYGSFGLLMLFPELEKSVIRAFARAIPASDDRTRIIGYYMTIGADSPMAVRKTAGATPHDLGAPNEHVWEKTNYTSYQDCNLWKDLSCDFVLQVYRAFLLTDPTDISFLQECWAAISQTMHYLKSFDKNFDGIPENSGAPDQTFDDWKLQGISAYCGGLWLAALEAAIAIGRILAENTADIRLLTSLSNDIGNFQLWLEQSSPLYQEKLWNGQYYRIDSDSGSDIVMTDQLCGQFYARLLHLPDIVPRDRAQSALRTVYDACFIKFNQYLASGNLQAQQFTTVQQARLAEQQTPETENQFKTQNSKLNISSLPLGAANGVRPDGTPENPNSTHPLEVWIGINFGLAAFMAQMGMEDEALAIAHAVIQQIYDNGLQFRTPEAITPSGTFRASHYLRAMAIWAVYGALAGEL